MKIAIFSDRTFFKFVLVGIINTIVGSAIMFLLYNAAHLNYWISSACNYCLIGVLSFFLNKYFTFGVKQRSAFIVFAYIMTIVISYLIAYGIAKPVMNYLLQNSPQKIHENAALFTGMCLFTVMNYLGQRLIVFRTGEKK